MRNHLKLAQLLGACLLLAQLSKTTSCSQQLSASRAAEESIVGNLQAAAAASEPAAQEESYQRVYDAFTKLIQNVSNNSLGNARRLVSRLNQLVGGGGETSGPAGAATPAAQQQQQQQQVAPAAKPAPAPSSVAQREQQQQDEKTEQILQRLDRVNKQTDQHTLRQLQDDVNRLVGTLGESYLRNIRRVIERVNRTIGSTSATGGGQLTVPPAPPAGVLHQSGDRTPQPGFPGWDELIVAMDRVQKELANFVRSSTKLITSGRRRR